MKFRLLIAVATGVALIILGVGATINKSVMVGAIPLVFGVAFVALSFWILKRGSR